MAFTKTQHILIAFLGISALLTTPSGGGPAYYGGLLIGVFGSLYALTYVGDKLLGKLRQVVRARVA